LTSAGHATDGTRTQALEMDLSSAVVGGGAWGAGGRFSGVRGLRSRVRDLGSAHPSKLFEPLLAPTLASAGAPAAAGDRNAGP
jgi:hypothetical protein